MVSIRKLISLSVIALLLSGCATALEHAVVSGITGDWKVGYANDSVINDTNIIEFIPKEESIKNWSKLITIQTFVLEDSAKTFMEKMKAYMVNRCKNTSWNIVKENSISVLYTWHITDCGEFPAESEVARVIKGKERMHRLAYTEKRHPMPEHEKQKWIKIFSEAYLEKDGKRVVLQNGL